MVPKRTPKGTANLRPLREAAGCFLLPAGLVRPSALAGLAPSGVCPAAGLPGRVAVLFPASYGPATLLPMEAVPVCIPPSVKTKKRLPSLQLPGWEQSPSAFTLPSQAA